jgi:hypothetical protein
LPEKQSGSRSTGTSPMAHFTHLSFWSDYRKLPEPVRHLADKNFALLDIAGRS